MIQPQLQEKPTPADFVGRAYTSEELTNEAYHNLAPGISKSGLDLIHKSPLDYKYRYIDGNKKDPTPNMILGSAVHKIILEPDTFDDEFAVYVPATGTGSRAINQAFKEDNAGKHLLTESERERLDRIAEAVRSHRHFGYLLNDGEPERSIFWRDEETSVICKARFDYVKETPDGPIVTDLKTIHSAETDEISKHIGNFRYYIQDAFYRDGFKAIYGVRPMFCFFFVESNPPHGIRIVTIDKDARGFGEVIYRRDLETYAKCLERDEWPSYPEEIQEVGLPAYIYYREGM